MRENIIEIRIITQIFDKNAFVKYQWAKLNRFFDIFVDERVRQIIMRNTKSISGLFYGILFKNAFVKYQWAKLSRFLDNIVDDENLTNNSDLSLNFI